METTIMENQMEKNMENEMECANTKITGLRAFAPRLCRDVPVPY